MWFVYVFISLISVNWLLFTGNMLLRFVLIGTASYMVLLSRRYYNRWRAIALIVFVIVVVVVGSSECSKSSSVLHHEILLVLEEKQREQSVQLIGETLGWTAQRYTIILTKNKPLGLSGTYIEVSGKAEPIKSPKNKYLFDYERYAISIRQGQQLFNPQMKKTTKTSGKQAIYRLKNELSRYIEERFTAKTAMFLKGLFLREQDMLKDSYEHLREMGFFQLMTLSVMVVKALQYLWLKLCRYTRAPFIIEAIGMSTISYVAHVFMWQSVAAAYLFVTTVLQYSYRIICGKRLAAISLVACVGIVLICRNPYIIFNSGFIFVFVLRFGLLLCRRQLKVTTRFGGVLVFPLFLFTLLLPVTLYNQGTVNFAQFLVYALIIPFQTLFLLFGGLALLLPATASFFLLVVVNVVQVYESLLPVYRVFTLRIVWLFSVASFVLYGLYFWLIETKRWRDGWKKCGAIVCFIIGTHYVNVNVASIHFLSLPYGEVTIIKGRGQTYVIDIGGNYKEEDNVYQTETIILPFLARLGITRIDHFILTHDDVDHVGAVPFFVANMPVDNVYYYASSFVFNELPSKNGAISYHQVTSRRQVGALVVLPLYEREERDVKTNNESLVSYGEFGGKRWLFMGDVEREGERRFVERYPHVRAEVLKLGHHGSRTSSSALFLQSVQPVQAIITVQVRNRHKHPHTDVLNRLQKYNIRYYNTNDVGSIHFFFWGSVGNFVIE